jgi:methylation protein EvaC
MTSTPECLACGEGFRPFMSFGRMPIANGFLTEAEFASEFFSELEVGLCEACSMVQLARILPPEKLFHQHYAYFSSISARMTEHFRRFAEDVRQSFLTGPRPFVVEIGSNDGILLQNFAKAGIAHLGVEPSANVAEAARVRGVDTVSRFFDESAGRDIRASHGTAQAVLGANVICHLPNIHSVIRGILAVLAEDGVFVFEEPYLGDIVQQASYDQFYDEHYFYYALGSLERLFARHGMEVIDVASQSVHGGSMRYVAARRGARRVQDSVPRLKAREAQLGLALPETYARLRSRIEASKKRLVEVLHQLKDAGQQVAGYGATSKSTTVTNYCGIGSSLVSFISDTTPGKQGRFSPGTHIPVVPYESFQEARPDCALLFAWNHAAEIVEKEAEFRRRGGKFLVYVPEVRFLE